MKAVRVCSILFADTMSIAVHFPTSSLLVRRAGLFGRPELIRSADPCLAQHPPAGGPPTLQPHPPPMPPATSPPPFKLPPWLEAPSKQPPLNSPFRAVPYPFIPPSSPIPQYGQGGPMEPPGAPGHHRVRSQCPPRKSRKCPSSAASAQERPAGVIDRCSSCLRDFATALTGVQPDSFRLAPSTPRSYRPANLPEPARLPMPVTPGHPEVCTPSSRSVRRF